MGQSNPAAQAVSANRESATQPAAGEPSNGKKPSDTNILAHGKATKTPVGTIGEAGEEIIGGNNPAPANDTPCEGKAATPCPQSFAYRHSPAPLDGTGWIIPIGKDGTPGNAMSKFRWGDSASYMDLARLSDLLAHPTQMADINAAQVEEWHRLKAEGSRAATAAQAARDELARARKTGNPEKVAAAQAALDSAEETARAPSASGAQAKAWADWHKTSGGLLFFGDLEGSKKQTPYVTSRTMINLDLDGKKGALGIDPEMAARLMGEILPRAPFRLAMHCTFNHSAKAPRLRVIVPLAEPMTRDSCGGDARGLKGAYELACLGVAHALLGEDLGAWGFDKASATLNQAMCLPVIPAGAGAAEEYRKWLWDTLGDEGRPLYDWRAGVEEERKRQGEGKGKGASKAPATAGGAPARERDPRDLPGVEGAFCRAYTVHEAIAKFLPDVYTLDTDGRKYRLTTSGPGNKGEEVTDGGLKLVTYDNNKLQDQKLNAFELCAFWLCAHPKGASGWGDKAIVKPALREFGERCKADPRVRAAAEAAGGEGAVLELLLQRDSAGNARRLTSNVLAILRQAPQFGRIGYDSFRDQLCVKEPWAGGVEVWRPWEDQHTAWAKGEISKGWGFEPPTGLGAAITLAAMERNQFDPQKERVAALAGKADSWEELESCLVRHLGAPDTDLTRRITKAFFCDLMSAAHLDPDWHPQGMLLLMGGQGIGKTSFFRNLVGDDWHVEIDFRQMADGHGGKEILEKARGKWIMDISEMGRFNEDRQTEIKGFLTRRDDTYRDPYATKAKTRRRRFVIVGASNQLDEGILLDTTGNRRYWPVVCAGVPGGRPLGCKEAERLLAQAKALYDSGARSSDFMGEGDTAMEEVRLSLMRKSEFYDDLSNFVRLAFPANWEALGAQARQDFLNGVAGYQTPSWVGQATQRRDWFAVDELVKDALGMDRRPPANDYKAIRRDMTALGFEPKTREGVRFQGGRPARMRGYQRKGTSGIAGPIHEGGKA